MFSEEANLRDYKRRRKEEKLSNWREKALQGEFAWQTSDVAGKESWLGMAQEWFFEEGQNRGLDPRCSRTSCKNKFGQAQHG